MYAIQLAKSPNEHRKSVHRLVKITINTIEIMKFLFTRFRSDVECRSDNAFIVNFKTFVSHHNLNTVRTCEANHFHKLLQTIIHILKLCLLKLQATDCKALKLALNWALISRADKPSAKSAKIFSDSVSTSKQIGSSPGAVTLK